MSPWTGDADGQVLQARGGPHRVLHPGRPPLLCDSGWVTHLRRQLELFSFGQFFGRLAERFTVIR